MYYSAILFALATVFTVYGTTEAQGVSIYQIGNKIYCGTLVCPDNAVNCKVSSKNDAKNQNIIVTKEICSDSSGKILDQKTYKKPNPSGGIVNSESGVGPQYAEDAQKQAFDIQQNVQNQIAQAFQNNPIFKNPFFNIFGSQRFPF